MKAKHITIVALILGAASVLPASAEPLTFRFEGTITTVSPEVGSEFSTGQACSYLYTFESTTPDSEADPTLSRFNGAISAFSATFAAYTTTSSTGDISVRDDYLGQGDSYFASTISGMGAPINGFSPRNIEVNLVGGPSIVFSSDAMPTIPPDPISFGNPNSRILFQHPDGRVANVFCGLQSAMLITATPAASDASLIAIGLLLAAILTVLSVRRGVRRSPTA